MSFLPYDGGSRLGWVSAFGLSGVIHGVAIVGILIMAGDAFQTEDTSTRTDFTITLERLDADTLAGFVEQAGLAGAEGEVPDEQDPDGQEPESVAPAPDPEQSVPEEPAEPEIPEEMQAEIPEAIEPETLAATTSDTIEEVLAPEPVQPEAVVAVPVAADTPDLSPILPETVAPGDTLGKVATVAPVAETISPVQPDAGSGLVLSPNTTAADDIQTVTAVSTAPPPAPPDTSRPQATAAPPSAQDIAIGDLIERIRASFADPCLIALPRRDGTDGIGLAMIAAQDGEMESFAQEVLTADDANIRQTRTLVDPRQCPALTYIRQNIDYPATRMGMRIDELEISSGGRLTGVLRGGSGRYITLLLVDDNGVVQDLQRFMSFSGNLARFDVPVTRSGPSRDTSQILLALGTLRPPVALRDRAGQLAQDVFSGVSGELATGAYLAIATFDVR